MYQPPKPKSPQPQPLPKIQPPLPQPKPAGPTPTLGAKQDWSGTINKSKITMHLERSGDRVTGQYSYEGKQGHLTLEGQLVRLASSPTLSLNLTEKDSQGQQTGTFTLYLRQTGLHGFWYSPKRGSGALGVNLSALQAPAPQPQPESAKPPTPPAPPKPAQASNLTGSIGKYGIRMSLSVQEGKLSGSYGYSSKGTETPFAVTGTVDAKGQATFMAGQETFTGTLSQDLKTFKGTWTAGGQTLPCELKSKETGVGPFDISKLKGTQLVAARAYNLHYETLLSFHKETGVRPEVMTAILCSESLGWAGTGNRMLIRFEVHKFYELWGINHQALFNQHFVFNRPPKPTWLGHKVSFDGKSWQYLHPDSRDFVGVNNLQHRALQLALSLGSGSQEAAYQCLGMGLGQVQGFNFRDAGFKSAEDMFTNLAESEGNQVEMMFSFFRKRPILIQRAVAENFSSIETIYNGGGQGGVYASSMRLYTNGLRKAAQSQGVDLLTGLRK